MMKNKSFIILLLCLVVVVAGASVAYNKLSDTDKAEIPVKTEKKEKAPNFIAYNEEGKMVKLSSFKGKPVVVNFWATWCGYCVQEFPVFQSQYEKYKDEVEFLMIDMTDGQRETVSVASAYIKEKGYTFPVAYDTELSAANAYSVRSIPMTVFVDSEGYITDVHNGSMNEELLNKYITKLIGE